MKNITKTTLLIDGDILAYRIASRNEYSFFDDELEEIVFLCNQRDARSQVDDELKFLTKKLKADIIRIFLSDKDNFRKEVLPSYKENRKGQRKPAGLGDIRRYLEKEHKAEKWTNLEADDVIGILATESSKDRRIMVSIDKDFESVPGWLFNPDKDSEPRRIRLENANHKFYTQTLTGDAVDGYKGVPGLGPKKVEKILSWASTEEEYWPLVLEQYIKAGLTEEDALVQARCARILRTEDYDYENKQPILWNPLV
jgi:DNA polymerase-1